MKIFYIDLDGTLLKKPNYNFTKDDVKALKKLQSSGNKFGIASGRSEVEIEFLEKQHSLRSNLTIGLNGMVVKKDDQIIKADLDQDVLDILLHNDIKFEAQDGKNRVFSSQEEHDFIPKILGTEMIVTKKMGNFNIRKIVVRQLFNKVPLSQIAKIIEKKGENKYNFFCVDNKSLEIVKKDISKGETIKKHFNENSVIAIGDSVNDEEMILLADQGYVMTNALPELKEKLKAQGVIEIKEVFEAIEMELAEIKGILFDLDGVIADTARYHYFAWKHVAKNLGIEMDEEFNESLKGVSREESLEKILALKNIVLNEKEFKSILLEKNELYLKYLGEVDETSILPGIKDFMINLKKKGKKIAVASASKNAPYILKKLNLLGYINYIADPSAVKNGKPEPDIFLDAMEKIGLKREEVVGIEDSQAGVDALLKANILAIGIGELKNSLYNLNSTNELNNRKTTRLIF